MRISDWSSDVCSSDLGRRAPQSSCSIARQGNPVHGASRGRTLTVDARSPTSSWQQATTTLPSSRVLRTLQPVVIVRPDTVSDCYNTARESQRSEEHTSELQSLMRISYAVFCLKK